jgi:hypothetical protein
VLFAAPDQLNSRLQLAVAAERLVAAAAAAEQGRVSTTQRAWDRKESLLALHASCCIFAQPSGTRSCS